METKKQNDEDEKKNLVYQCPMRCEEKRTYNHQGNCPVCNMKLIPINDKNAHGFQHFFG
jgi:transcription initiation factor IIE alpha subunit